MQMLLSLHQLKMWNLKLLDTQFLKSQTCPRHKLFLLLFLGGRLRKLRLMRQEFQAFLLIVERTSAFMTALSIEVITSKSVNPRIVRKINPISIEDNSCLHRAERGGSQRTRTSDIFGVNEALYQLS